uniref:Uncharacterized protein n=1 Tax=viral metagenome TaxID=1070528 RepID=A0A6M3L379_9ZZZZ
MKDKKYNLNDLPKHRPCLKSEDNECPLCNTGISRRTIVPIYDQKDHRIVLFDASDHNEIVKFIKQENLKDTPSLGDIVVTKDDKGHIQIHKACKNINIWDRIMSWCKKLLIRR